MHLTNYAINKNSQNFNRCEEAGSKRSLESIFKLLAETKQVDIDEIWQNISDAIIKTIILVQPTIAKTMTACFPGKRRPLSASDPVVSSPCFEILGFDVLLDTKFKPWILEVNHSPSFTCDSELDTRIKTGVIKDVFPIINIKSCIHSKFKKEEKSKSQSRLLSESTSSNIKLPPIVKRASSGNSTASLTSVPTLSSQTEESGSSEKFEDMQFKKDASVSELMNESVLAKMEATLNRHQKWPFEETEFSENGYRCIFPPSDPEKMKQYVFLLTQADRISESKAKKAVIVNSEQVKTAVKPTKPVIRVIHIKKTKKNNAHGFQRLQELAKPRKRTPPEAPRPKQSTPKASPVQSSLSMSIVNLNIQN
jgi:hypothetical protein